MSDTFKNLGTDIETAVMQAMQTAGEKITDGMRERLAAGAHIDTGALYESIRAETTTNGNTVTTLIYADAKSEDGTQYQEFLELGTGAAHGRSGGRQGTWRYKDHYGNWHTTDGMDADPFIEPSVSEVIPELDGIIKDCIYDIAKYRGGGSDD